MPRFALFLATTVCFAGCAERDSESVTTPVVASEPLAIGTQNNSDATDSQNVGTVAHVEIDDAQHEENLNGRLHFCVFDNGESDTIYVGTKYGMWSKGEFDLEIGGKTVFTGHVPHLVYGGVVIDMGNALEEQPKSNIGVHITRVTGMFK